MASPVETERKFLIQLPSAEQLKKVQANKTNIVQTYLRRLDPKVERRVRKRGADGNFVYYYTEKRKLSKLSRDEYEMEIAETAYLELLKEGISQLSKVRYCWSYEDQCLELDVYPDWENEAILEIELVSEEQEVKLPDWIIVIKEVTGDDKYKNANLAKKII